MEHSAPTAEGLGILPAPPCYGLAGKAVSFNRDKRLFAPSGNRSRVSQLPAEHANHYTNGTSYLGALQLWIRKCTIVFQERSTLNTGRNESTKEFFCQIELRNLTVKDAGNWTCEFEMYHGRGHHCYNENFAKNSTKCHGTLASDSITVSYTHLTLPTILLV